MLWLYFHWDGKFFLCLEFLKTLQKMYRYRPCLLPEEALQVKDFAQWFGVATEKKTAVKKKEFIPKTSLNLRLKGVLVEIGDRASSAVIQGTDGKDMLYAKRR